MINYSPSRLVLAFAGRIHSGKTTVTMELAGRLGWPRVSFGDFVRNEATRSGRGVERETLQALGGAMVADLGPEGFCERFLSYVGSGVSTRSFVIDGVRHYPVLVSLRQILSPTPVRLIYLSLSDEEQATRLQSAKVPLERAELWNAHSTEEDSKSILADRADMIIESSSVAVESILNWLIERERGSLLELPREL